MTTEQARPAAPASSSGPRDSQARPSDPRSAGARPRFKRRGPPIRKVCRFCVDKVGEIDYKSANTIRSFMTERGRILSARTTGNCAKHQRQLTTAIKRAQTIALLPYTLS